MTASQKSVVWRLLRPLLALAMLAAVAYVVPWRDEVQFSRAATAVEAEGTILGDWRSERVSFEFREPALLGPEWPTQVREAALRGPVALSRAPDVDVPEGFTWRPGMLRVFRELDPSGLVVALTMILVGAIVAVTRWWRLLALAGCATTWWNAFRLTFLGFFFNLVMPGLTGGDVVKAVLVVREHPERRADALMSVIVDRGLGLIVLVGLAAFVTLASGDLFAELKIPVVLTFGGAVTGLWCVLHPWPRRILRLESVLARLPQAQRLQALDRALRIYNRHPGEMLVAIALSVANHSSLAYGLFALGHAFGDHLSWMSYLGVASIANTISSIPIAPGGWGVREAAFGSLFHMLGSPAALGIAVSVTYGLLSTALGFAGGIFLLLPHGRGVRAEIEQSET